MTQLSVFDLAAKQADWLAQRQATIATNIVNANTPNYAPRDIKPPAGSSDFASVMLARTNSAHMSVDAGAGGTSAAYQSYRPASWETSLSGNSVSLEQQMTIQNQIGRSMSLNATVVRAFQRMMLANVKA